VIRPTVRRLWFLSLAIPASAALGQVPNPIHHEALGPNPCYTYDRDTISLVGKLTWRVYPGRPNYESVQLGDEPDTVVVLQLSHPICLRASGRYQAHQNVVEVQLILPENDYRTVIRRPGRHATLAGTLTGADFGWHHLEVLFETHFATVPRGAARS
jgi:hypothetical protein